MSLRVAMFYHSLVSDWNHGNAHFLRGVASEFIARGYSIRIFEPEHGWSRENLLRENGAQAIDDFERVFPRLKSEFYRDDEQFQLDEWLGAVDLAIVHEWNAPELVAAIGRYRLGHSHLKVLFHDTHHRALTAQDELSRFDLNGYDGVLAYGASLKDAYERLGWGRQVHVWHEAADTRGFYPRPYNGEKRDVVWIGNWGDEERTQELREFFLRPVKQLGLRAQAHGVRYPDFALRELQDAGVAYAGWLPNHAAPEAFARFRATVHVPRRPYVRQLPGIPTIRPFEALACGIPLLSAPWQDSEDLFRVGKDFLMAQDGEAMQLCLRDVIEDPGLRASLAASGLETIKARHTCAHRVNELLVICGKLDMKAFHSVTPVPEMARQ